MNRSDGRDYDTGDFGEDYYDEDGFEEGRPGPKGPLSRPPGINDMVPVVVFMFLCLAGTLLFQSEYRDFLWVSYESVFTKGEYWRPVTALFAHSNLMHLLSNSFILIGFGWMLRSYFGFIIFPAASLFIGIATNLTAVYFYEPDVRVLGASGMAYGMVALWLMFYIRYDTDRPVPMRIFRAVGFSLIMLVPTAIEPNVSYLSHGAGFVIGIITGILLLNSVTVVSKDDRSYRLQ